MKRIIPAIMTLLTLLCACGEAAAQAPADTTAAAASTEAVTESETETEIFPDVPDDLDFGGRTFTILCNEYPVPGWTQYDIDAEELNGSPVNDAVFTRNSVIEEKYNCVINERKIDYGQVSTTLSKVVKAGDPAIDIATPLFWCGQIATNATAGLFVDLNTVPTMNLSSPWYDQQSVRDFGLMDRLYFITSDLTIGDLIATAGMVFNKKLYDDYQYASSYGDIYDLVRSGKWTLEMMKTMVLSLSSDLNGDGVMNDLDFYGLLYQRDSLPSFFNAFGMRVADVDGDGMPVYTLINDTNAVKLDALFSFLYTKENCFHVMNWFDKTSTDFTTGMCNMFMNNQGMFMWIRFADVEMLRNMDIDFGIIPVPKWDEPQEQYYSAVNQHMGTATVIPVSCESVDMEGCFLEVLCCESMKKLIPAYYDVTLQGKVTRDEESVDMLDLIFENRVYDIGSIFNFGNFGQDMYQMTVTYDSSYASIWAKKESKYATALEKFITKYQEIGM